MTAERVKWSALILFVAVMSAAVVVVADVSPWVAGLILLAWLIIFVGAWPEEGESA